MITYPVIRITAEDGKEFVFEDTDVLTCKLVEEINPVAIEVPISTVEFSIYTEDTGFSMFSGKYFQLFSQRLPIMLYQRIIEDGGYTRDVFIGRFYIQKWENTGKFIYHCIGVDILGLLDSTPFDGQFWETETTLSVAANDVLNSIGVTPYIDPEVAAKPIKGWIAPGTYREAVQQLCFATMTTASTARKQTLNILEYKPLPPALIFEDLEEHGVVFVPDSQKNMNDTIELLPLATEIELVSHNYLAGDTPENIFDENLEAGSHKIIFEKPYFNITVLGPGYESSTLITEGGDYLVTENGNYIAVSGEFLFGTNALYLNLAAPGRVTVSGYPWIDSQVSYIERQNVPDAYNKNAVIIQDATLVNVSNANSVLTTLKKSYDQRYVQKTTLFGVELAAGSKVQLSSGFGKNLVGVIKKVEMDLNGGHRLGVETQSVEYVIIWTIRKPRTGLAICGTGMMRQNRYRR